MPVTFKTERVPAFGGCDVCGERAECSDFIIRHTFGYGSPIDGNSVDAAVCDACLENINVCL